MLPRGVYLWERTCPDCGKPVIYLDEVEGLKIYACPDRCRIDRDHPASRKPGDGLDRAGVAEGHAPRGPRT